MGFRVRFASLAAVGLLLLAGAGVHAAQQAKPALQVVTERDWQAAIKVHDSMNNCSNSIGMTAAKAIVRYCRYMSGATHPPCDTENPCSVITDHVAAQVNSSNTSEIIPGESTLKAPDWKIIASLHAE
jgi:hypothetical protein